MTLAPSPLRLPNFLIVGTMKSATTSLADLLGSHPDCFVAPREVHFFNHEDSFARGPAYYATFFADANGALAVGEKTPSYSEQVRHPDIPQRIREMLGPIKLVWIFREPVARTISHYRHAVIVNSVREPFDTVITRELDEGRFTAAPMVARSRYCEQVRLYLQHFPSDLMHFCLFEDFVRDPTGVTGKVAAFLGLDPDPRHLTGSASRNRTGVRADAQKRKAGPWGRFLLARRDRLLESPGAEMLARLGLHFEAPNAELARVTGLDLSGWRKHADTR